MAQGEEDNLTFACYRGSFATPTSNPQKYQQILAYQKKKNKYQPISYFMLPQKKKKKRSLARPEIVNCAKHTEMPLNC